MLNYNEAARRYDFLVASFSDIAMISGAMLLTIAAGSIYGKSVSSHTESEPDVVGTFSMNWDEHLTVVANREQIEDKVAFARELLQMYKDNSFYAL